MHDESAGAGAGSRRLAAATVYVTSRTIARNGSETETPAEFARRAARQTFGTGPFNMDARFDMRAVPSGVMFLTATAMFLLATVAEVGLRASGVDTDAAVLRWASAAYAPLLGLCVIWSVRAVAVGVDYRRWLAAGQPEAWVPSRVAMLYDFDLLLAAPIAAGVVAFMWAL